MMQSKQPQTIFANIPMTRKHTTERRIRFSRIDSFAPSSSFWSPDWRIVKISKSTNWHLGLSARMVN